MKYKKKFEVEAQEFTGTNPKTVLSWAKKNGISADAIQEAPGNAEYLLVRTVGGTLKVTAGMFLIATGAPEPQVMQGENFRISYELTE